MKPCNGSEVQKNVEKIKKLKKPSIKALKVVPKPDRIKKLKKQCDDLASKLIRTRDGFICQHCLDRYNKGLRPDKPQYCKNNHHAHIITRSNKSTRWLLLNGLTLCYYCHIIWSHREPSEFIEWIKDFIGEDNYNELLRLSQQKAYTSEEYLISAKEMLEKQIKEIE